MVAVRPLPRKLEPRLAPSGKFLNVPTTGLLLSFLIIGNVSPSLSDTLPDPAMLSVVADAMMAMPPAVTTWSNCPAASLVISISSEEATFKTTLPTSSEPILDPGDKRQPSAINTPRLIVPVPPSTTLLPNTLESLPGPITPFTSSWPPLIQYSPVNGLLPVKVNVPVPTFRNRSLGLPFDAKSLPV